MNTFDKIGTAIFLRECCLYTDETDYDNIVMYDGNLATLNHCEFSFYIPTSCIFFFRSVYLSFQNGQEVQIIRKQSGPFLSIICSCLPFHPSRIFRKFPQKYLSTCPLAYEPNLLKLKKLKPSDVASLQENCMGRRVEHYIRLENRCDLFFFSKNYRKISGSVYSPVRTHFQTE